jgi:phosphate transport system permease protein
MTTAIFVFCLALTGLAYHLGRRWALAAGGVGRLHSLPSYHGYYVAICAALPAVILLLAWPALEPALLRLLLAADAEALARDMGGAGRSVLWDDARSIANGRELGRPASEAMRAFAADYLVAEQRLRMGLGIAIVALVGMGFHRARRRVAPVFRARQVVEQAVSAGLMLCALVAVLTTVGIVLSLLFETARFFALVPVQDFLFGTVWSPQIALRADQVGSSGGFGAVPLFAGTLLISGVALFVAGPIGLASAIYLAEFATPGQRGTLKPLLEVLAGIPTVVYGFFAALTVAPLIRSLGEAAGLDVASESALAAGLVMGVMVIPSVSSLSDDVINAVPQNLREGSYALGATQAETILRVVLPAALPGIVGAFMLAISRAIGETMIVVMAAGLTGNLTGNPLQAVTTVTVQIATLLVGDQEFDNPKTLAAFALGLTLFLATLALNVGALIAVKRYREQYD